MRSIHQKFTSLYTNANTRERRIDVLNLKSFFYLSVLIVVKKIHTGKSFECSASGKAFAQESQLSVHKNFILERYTD